MLFRIDCTQSITPKRFTLPEGTKIEYPMIQQATFPGVKPRAQLERYVDIVSNDSHHVQFRLGVQSS